MQNLLLFKIQWERADFWGEKYENKGYTVDNRSFLFEFLKVRSKIAFACKDHEKAKDIAFQFLNLDRHIEDSYNGKTYLLFENNFKISSHKRELPVLCQIILQSSFNKNSIRNTYSQ